MLTFFYCTKSYADLYCIHLPVLYLYSGVQETQTRSRRNREHIHPSTFWHLSRVGGQQSIHSSSALLFPSFLLQAFQSHVLGLPQGLPLVGYAQNTSLRRCPAGILVIYLNSLTPPSPIPSLRESRAAFQGKHYNLIQSLTQVNKMGATVHPSQVWLCPKFPAEHGLLYFQSENKRQSARRWIVILSKDFSASNNAEVKCIYLKLTNYLILFCPYKNIIDHKRKGDICGLFLGYRNWLHKNIWCTALISKLSKYFWCQTVLQWVKTVASKGQLARLGVTA